MNQLMQNQQLSRMSEKITKELEAILGCEVITTDFPRNNFMQFYIFLDSEGKRSTKEWYNLYISCFAVVRY